MLLVSLLPLLLHRFPIVLGPVEQRRRSMIVMLPATTDWPSVHLLVWWTCCVALRNLRCASR